MKNSTISITGLLLAFFFSLSIKASGPYKLEYDSLSCLQIEGKVIMDLQNGFEDECMVELISDNEVQNVLVLKEGKSKFKFVLKKNLFYAIRISKKGYVTKLISVDTEILTENEGIHMFKFETHLISEAVGAKLNQDAIDFPVTIIHFSYETDSFVHNSEYTAYIKRELHKSNPPKRNQPKKIYFMDERDGTLATR